MGTGVPWPVQPKSQMHFIATAKPSADVTTPIQRQPDTPRGSTRKPIQGGSNQNQSARNPAPTASDASAVGQLVPRFALCGTPACPEVMNGSSIAKVCAHSATPATRSTICKNTGYLGRRVTRAIQTVPAKRLSNL